jgi:hypothetical protein
MLWLNAGATEDCSKAMTTESLTAEGSIVFFMKRLYRPSP